MGALGVVLINYNIKIKAEGNDKKQSKNRYTKIPWNVAVLFVDVCAG